MKNSLKQFFRNLFPKYETKTINCTMIDINQKTKDMQADGWKIIDTIGYESGIYNIMFERRMKQNENNTRTNNKNRND